ncbi:hypothetical protein EJ07DRAFT_154162 [Lizonia empirigonia]|nr:hypothetical protein EJ07DRAFT_154162 [Lizonia empirigonia]
MLRLRESMVLTEQRCRGVTVGYARRARRAESQRLLNTTQEQELVKYIETLSKRGLPPTREMIRNFASEIARKPVDKAWADRFIARHRDHLLLKWTSGKDSNRHKADSLYKYEEYFKV